MPETANSVRRSGRRADRLHNKHLDSDFTEEEKKKNARKSAKTFQVSEISPPVLHNKVLLLLN